MAWFWAWWWERFHFEGNRREGNMNQVKCLIVPFIILVISGSVQGIDIDGELTIDASSGTLGSYSENTAIGNLLPGHLIVENGGRAESQFTYVGRQPSVAGALTVRGENSIFDDSGFIPNPTGQSSLYVGYRGDGSLSISDGGTVQSWWSQVAWAVGTQADVTIDGAGSIWEVAQHLYVGWNGEATINVINGGKLKTLRSRIAYLGDGKGVVNVVGPTSIWDSGEQLGIGHHGNTEGTLNILAGGTVMTDHGMIGRINGGSGVANIDGMGSIWQADFIDVGRYGQGTMNVVNGGRVESNRFMSFIGRFDGTEGQANVVGTDSVWHLTTHLNVGYQAIGELNIQEGGRVENVNGIIGADYGVDSSTFGTGVFSSGVGIVNVEGLGSVWQNNRDVFIGDAFETQGTLNVLSAGRVNSRDGYLGTGESSTATANISGENSVWSLTRDLYIGGNSTEGVSSGHVNVNEMGMLSVAGNVTIWEPGSLNLSGGVVHATDINVQGGLLAGTGAVTGTINVDAGVLAPDAIMLQGNLSLGDEAILDVEMVKDGLGIEHSFIDVSGEVILGGNLQLTLTEDIQSFVSETDIFELILADTAITGHFLNAASGDLLATMDGFGSFRVFYGLGSPYGDQAVVLSDYQPNIAVPTPTAASMMLVVLAMMGWWPLRSAVVHRRS